MVIEDSLNEFEIPRLELVEREGLEMIAIDTKIKFESEGKMAFFYLKLNEIICLYLAYKNTDATLFCQVSDTLATLYRADKDTGSLASGNLTILFS